MAHAQRRASDVSDPDSAFAAARVTAEGVLVVDTSHGHTKGVLDRVAAGFTAVVLLLVATTATVSRVNEQK